MMAEQVENFIEGLIERTKEGKLNWRNFLICSERQSIIQELENGRGNIDFMVNSIRENSSYFLQSNGGYVFLFEIYHGDPSVTSPEMDSLSLMVKINPSLPLDNLSNFGVEEQQNLETLRITIEHYIEDKYSYPDVLYKFMSDVLADQ